MNDFSVGWWAGWCTASLFAMCVSFFVPNPAAVFLGSGIAGAAFGLWSQNKFRKR